MLITSNLPISPSQILIQSHSSFTSSNVKYLLLQYYNNSIFLAALTPDCSELNLKVINNLSKYVFYIAINVLIACFS
jgi:hypothetical protein